MTSSLSFTASDSLLERARRVFPSGGITAPRTFFPDWPEPLFFASADGARCRDVDGNTYIDFVLGYGAVVLGHADRRLNDAVARRLADGHLFTHNSPLHVELAERLVAAVPGAGKVLLFKTGSCATTAAMRIARARTGREVVVRCGYNGWHDWTLADGAINDRGVPAGLATSLVSFGGRPEELEAILAEACGEVACVSVVPEDLDLAQAAGALFVLDEIKTGIRTEGGTFQTLCGVQADLTTVSKALANGFPLSAVVGTDDAMSCDVYVDSTFQAETASIAAALHTLDRFDDEDLDRALRDKGQRFIDGLNASFAAHGLDDAAAFGAPTAAMPDFRLHPTKEVSKARRAMLAYECLRRGVLCHPTHVLFVTPAHDDATIDAALDRIDDIVTACAPAWLGEPVAASSS